MNPDQKQKSNLQKEGENSMGSREQSASHSAPENAVSQLRYQSAPADDVDARADESCGVIGTRVGAYNTSSGASKNATKVDAKEKMCLTDEGNGTLTPNSNVELKDKLSLDNQTMEELHTVEIFKSEIDSNRIIGPEQLKVSVIF